MWCFPVNLAYECKGSVWLQRDTLQLSYICKVSCLEIYQVALTPVLCCWPSIGTGCSSFNRG